MSALAPLPLTPDEYLMEERKAELKSEYLGGKLYAMAGASRQHNLITFNLAVELGSQLRGREAEAYLNDMRVKVNAADSYAYPDVAIVYGEPEFEDDQFDTLTNPQALIEVLSPSTEKRDREIKFEQYQQIASLTDYVLIAQDAVHIEHYHWQDGQWHVQALNDLRESLQLDSIGCRIPLQAIYHKVRFGDAS